MRSVVAVLVGCLSLVACAPPQPPPQPTAADLARPHDLYVNDPRPRVTVDADTSVTVPTFIPLSPLGLLVGAVTTLAVVAVQAPGALSREAAQEALQTAAGETAPISREFADSLRQSLRAALRDVPTLEVQEVAGRPPTEMKPGRARLIITEQLAFTPDARMLVARASVHHARAESADGRNATRQFLVFSSPIQEAPGVPAMNAWVAEEGRALRQQVPVLARELATLIRSAVLDPAETPPMETLPQVTLRTPGIGLIMWEGPNGPASMARLPERISVYLLRRDGGRSVVIARIFRSSASYWVWISVPDEVLEADRPS